MIIGVLALQGDFFEHTQALQQLNVTSIEVRTREQLTGIDGLILPGGESTTMAKLLNVFQMRDILIAKVKKGLPVWGTCAGMILMAKKLDQTTPTPLDLMDIQVSRNAFGSQINSFSESLLIPKIDATPFHATFIRAPVITKVFAGVSILATLSDNKIVAAQQDNLLATAFHPELTTDMRLHEYFLKMVSR